jgi:hypothetical protein
VSAADDAIEVSDDKPEKPEVDAEKQLGMYVIVLPLHSLTVSMQTNSSSPGAPQSMDFSSLMS